MGEAAAPLAAAWPPKNAVGSACTWRRCGATGGRCCYLSTLGASCLLAVAPLMWASFYKWTQAVGVRGLNV